MPKQSCVNCHFFAKRIPATGGTSIYHPTPPERESARNGNYGWVRPREDYPQVLCCQKGVWDEGYHFDKDRRHEEIVARDRKDFCFFLKYHEGMLFPAGQELERRQRELREASRDRRLTIWGLFIAAIALVANLIVSIVQLCRN